MLRPVQAFDVSGRARALSTIVQALAQAKESGIDGEALNKALTLVNWERTTMPSDLKMGDVVKLKSGGPEVTIGETGYNALIVTCHWFSGKDHKTAQFPLDALERYTPPASKQLCGMISTASN